MSARRLARSSSSRLTALGFRIALLALLLAALRLDAQAPSAESREPSPATKLRDSARVLIDNAMPAGDVDGFRAARALLERALTVEPNDGWLLHYLGFALYREVGVTVGRTGKMDDVLLEQADAALERAGRVAQIPETHAVRSGVLGMMIGSSPLKGMTLGPRAGAQMERALELDPSNPRVWLMRGVGAMNTPEMFGGGLEKAEEYLVKSIALFSGDKPAAPAPSWGAGEVHAWLGQVYARQGKKDAARAEYQRALAIEPNDAWVKFGLLPALDKSK
jgi:tetratricopeptide (TPR) repeat protein